MKKLVVARNLLFSFIGVILLLFFAKCNGSHQVEHRSHRISQNLIQEKNLRFVFDSLRITSEMIKGKGGGNHASYFYHKDSSYLVFQDCNNNKLDVYNVENHKDSWSFKFNTNENRWICETSHSFFFKDKTSFYMLSEDGIFREYKNGVLKILFNLNTDSVMVANGMMIDPSLNADHEIYISGDSILYFPVEIDPDHTQKTYSNYNYNYPVSAMFNLKTRSFIAFTGAKFPEILHTKDYGLNNIISHLYTGDNIYYAFGGLPEIWEFDPKTDSTTYNTVRSKYQDQDILPLNFKRTPYTKDKLWQHYLLSAAYRRLVYDPYKRCYYRFFVHPLAEKNKEGLFNTYMDKKISLMVLDEQFNLIGETMLPDECFFIFFAIPARNGLYINYGPITNPIQNGIKLLKIAYHDS